MIFYCAIAYWSISAAEHDLPEVGTCILDIFAFLEKGTTEDEMIGWHHRLYGREFEQAPDGQGSLACCSP